MPLLQRFSLLSGLVFLFSFADSKAQYHSKLYEWGLGFKAGGPQLISARHFIRKEISLEALAGIQFFSPEIHWRMLGVAIQYQTPIPDSKNLNFFAGGGLAFIQWYWKQSYKGRAYPRNVPGAFLQLGVEYRLKRRPLSLSIEWTPFYQAKGYDQGTGFVYGGIGIRYILR